MAHISMQGISKTLVAALLLWSTLSCQTIEVVNDQGSRNASGSMAIDWTWNHMGIFGLVNYSSDFQASHFCPQSQWASIKTELNYGPLAAVTGMSIAGVIPAVSPIASLASFLWTPRAVAWRCQPGPSAI